MVNSAICSSSYGSSPRARGTGVVFGLRVTPTRFIPARAGNGSRAAALDILRAVHPRARGERTGFVHPVRFVAGSSPRARGTAEEHWRLAPGTRFIPARAGNGHTRGMPSGSLPVHPRARGERSTTRGRAVYFRGSSPRARGTAMAAYREAEKERFIPARAGNGSGTPTTQPTETVHPRARGERFNDIPTAN